MASAAAGGGTGGAGGIAIGCRSSGRDRSGHSDPIGSILLLTLTTGLVRAFAGGPPCTVADPPPTTSHGVPRQQSTISREPVACCSRRIQPPRSNSCKQRATCPGEYPHRRAIDRLHG